MDAITDILRPITFTELAGLYGSKESIIDEFTKAVNQLDNSQSDYGVLFAFMISPK